MMSFLKYSTYMWMKTDMISLCGDHDLMMHGIGSCMYVTDGDASCLLHHVACVCNCFVQTKDRWKRCWISGRRCQLPYWPLERSRNGRTQLTSLPHSRSAIGCVKLTSTASQVCCSGKS